MEENSVELLDITLEDVVELEDASEAVEDELSTELELLFPRP